MKQQWWTALLEIQTDNIFQTLVTVDMELLNLILLDQAFCIFCIEIINV